MDPKAQALKSAKEAVDKAKTALSEAQTALQTAKDAEDEAATTAAQGKVSSATQALADAEAKVTELESDAGAEADELLGSDGKPKLADGTDPKKKIEVPKDKFDDLNEKAKLLEQFAPLLAKLKADPTLVDKLMAGDNPDLSIQQRLDKLEAGIAAEKRNEVKSVITKAIQTWPDFKDNWEAIKPILSGLEASGIPYTEAVQRAYFAVRPDAIKENKRLVESAAAREIEKQRGKGSMGGGSGPIEGDTSGDEYELNEQDKEFAAKTGLDPKLYSKHAEFIDRFKDL